MTGVRKYKLIFAFIGIALFALPMVANFGGVTLPEIMSYFSNNFEDPAESTEDINTENKLKEYHFNNLDQIMLHKKHASNSIEFGQLDFDLSLEVFLEVVTPPPEA